jgi:DNA topoisomerase VI subunit A
MKKIRIKCASFLYIITDQDPISTLFHIFCRLGLDKSSFISTKKFTCEKK